MKEEWRYVKDYENYMVSNWGRVKSLNYRRTGKERILKPGKDSNGYLIVCLLKNGKQKTHKIHQLVWDTFGDRPRNGMILQVDHINNDKTDNRIENLQLLSNRANCSKGKLQKEKTSKYTGVCFYKNRWLSYIDINKKRKYLGCFSTEKEATKAYQNALKNINNDKG